MPITTTSMWERDKLEYEHAFLQFQHHSTLRRQDMAFVTTVQVAVFSIIGQKILSMDLVSTVLSLFAFFVCVMGLNNERRLSAYMTGYMARARQIESNNDMTLAASGRNELKKRKFLFSNTTLFPLYYVITLAVWLVIWAQNLLIKK